MSVHDRIIKLLKLSKSDNQHEAANAAARAAELMAKHELTEAELRTVSGAPEIEKADVYQYRRDSLWKRELTHGCCEGFGCRAYEFRVLGVSYVRIIGTVPNVAASTYTFKYLANEIDDLARKAGGSQVWLRSFRLGVAVTLRRRMREAREAVHARPGQSDGARHALVLVNRDAARVDAAYDELGPKKNNASTHSATLLDDALAAGARAGRHIKLAAAGALQAWKDQLHD